MKFDVVIVAAGLSTRAGLNKLHFSLGGMPILERTLNAFLRIAKVENIVLVVRKDDFEFANALKAAYKEKNIIIAEGGATRSQSVLNGLNACASEGVLVHDGARPYVDKELIERVMQGVEEHGSAIPSLPLTDSVRVVKNGTIVEERDRNALFTVQTPQGFLLNDILNAYSHGEENTDESALYLKYIQPPTIVEGSERNRKLTTNGDFNALNVKVGIGYDLHRLVPFKKFMLGGIELEHNLGVLAHSDGDVIIHAIIDALLGAIGERDIGTLFPDNDPKYLDIDSSIMLSEVMDMLKERNYKVSSVSIVVILEKPKLKDVIPLMRIKLSRILEIESSAISIAAKTNEGIGSIGEGLAVAAYATVTVVQSTIRVSHFVLSSLSLTNIDDAEHLPSLLYMHRASHCTIDGAS